MMKKKKLTRIGIDVDEEMLIAVDEIAKKERWPRRVVAMAALENYIKLRSGQKKEG